MTVLALSVACSDAVGPEQLVRPHLRALAIDDLTTSLRHGGILFLNGQPADSTFRLDSDERAPVAITVTSGDHESVGLYRLFCPPRDRSNGYDCFSFTVLMESGYHAADLAGHVASLGGRFRIVSPTGIVAGITVFDPSNLVQRAGSARNWPGVAITELLFPGGRLADLHLPVPVDTGGAVSGDGIVQVRSGDTVQVVYQQPDGSTIEARRAVP